MSRTDGVFRCDFCERTWDAEKRGIPKEWYLGVPRSLVRYEHLHRLKAEKTACPDCVEKLFKWLETT